MPLDPSIYNRVGRANLGQGLGEALTGFADRQNRLSELARQQVGQERQGRLQDLQIRSAQRVEDAFPAQQAAAKQAEKQKHIQELAYGLSQGLDPQHGVDRQTMQEMTIQEARNRGLDDNDMQQLFAPLASGKDDAALSQYYLSMANPQEAQKRQIEAAYRKPEAPKEKPAVNWTTVQTDKGIVQVNPQTGQIRPLGVNAPAKPAISGVGAKLSPTAQKELFEADDTAQSSKNVQAILQSAMELNDTTYSGYGAKARATLRSNLPGSSPEADNTVQLDNMMTGQALESLKAVFGGMPTEGERKILLEMQASADKTPAQRKDIMQRAITAAKKREQFSLERAKSLRAGTYFSEQPADTGAGEDQTWSDL